MSDRQITVLQSSPVLQTVVQSPVAVSTLIAGPAQITQVVQPAIQINTGLSMVIQTLTELKNGQGPAGPSGAASTYETISQNIRAKNKAFNYVAGVLQSIVFEMGGGQYITKAFGYVSGILTTVTLSGDVPGGISLVKTLLYTGGDLSGVVYT